MRLIQVTLGAAATPITTNTNIYCSVLIIQCNSAAGCTIGDSTVTATRGIRLAPASTPPGGSLTSQPFLIRGTHLQDWFLFGTSGQVIDVLYESAT